MKRMFIDREDIKKQVEECKKNKICPFCDFTCNVYDENDSTYISEWEISGICKNCYDLVSEWIKK